MGSRTTISGARARRDLSRRPCGLSGSFSFRCLCATCLRGAGLPTPRPADALLRLVPPDVAVVVTVEGLRDHASAFLKSRLAGDLRRLPAVRAWLASEKYQHFERSRAQIETLLGANLTDVRDELLGDAVILALRLPPEAPADASQARGILLVQARDPALLERLIRVVNTIQQESGELAGVAERQRNGTTYHVREFPAAANRPPEWYVAYPDGTFAFSNSEAMIQSVIDRKARRRTAQTGRRPARKSIPAWVSCPGSRRSRGKLPERALARLFVDPRHFERLLAGAAAAEQAERCPDHGDARALPCRRRLCRGGPDVERRIDRDPQRRNAQSLVARPLAASLGRRRAAGRSHARARAADRPGRRLRPRRCARPSSTH